MSGTVEVGHFWRQSQPELKYPGTMTRRTDGTFEVAILGSLGLNDGQIGLTQFQDGESICGYCGNQYYRFLEPWQTSMELRIPGQIRETWVSGFGLSSSDENALSKNLYKSAQIGLRNLEQVLNLFPMTPGTVEIDGKRVHVVKRNEPIVHENQFSRGTLRLEVLSNESTDHRRTVSFSLDVSLTIEFHEPMPIVETTRVFERVHNLISLLTGLLHVPTREVVLSEKVVSEDQLSRIFSPVFVERQRANITALGMPNLDDLLIAINGEQFVRLVAAWVDFGSVFDVPSAMVLSRQQNRVLLADVNLLLNVSALESLHSHFCDPLKMSEENFNNLRSEIRQHLTVEQGKWVMENTRNAKYKSMKDAISELAQLTTRSDAFEKLNDVKRLREIRDLRNSVSHQNRSKLLNGRRLFSAAIVTGYLATVVMLSKVLDKANLDLRIRVDRLTQIALDDSQEN